MSLLTSACGDKFSLENLLFLSFLKYIIYINNIHMSFCSCKKCANRKSRCSDCESVNLCQTTSTTICPTVAPCIFNCCDLLAKIDEITNNIINELTSMFSNFNNLDQLN